MNVTINPINWTLILCCGVKFRCKSNKQTLGLDLSGNGEGLEEGDSDARNSIFKIDKMFYFEVKYKDLDVDNFISKYRSRRGGKILKSLYFLFNFIKIN